MVMAKGELDAATVEAMGRGVAVWVVEDRADGSRAERPMLADPRTVRMMRSAGCGGTVRVWRAGYVRGLPYALVSGMGRVTCVRVPEHDRDMGVWRLDVLGGVRMLVPDARMLLVVEGARRADSADGSLTFPDA